MTVAERVYSMYMVIRYEVCRKVTDKEVKISIVQRLARQGGGY